MQTVLISMQAAGSAGPRRPTPSIRKSDGTVWAWGSNNKSQLGDGTTTNSSTPVQSAPGVLTGITAVAAGNEHSLALKSDGTVWAWGSNSNGQLGDNSTTDHAVPVQVSGLTNVTAIAAGVNFSLALKSDGTVWAWGYNGSGQLGDSSTTDRWTPVQAGKWRRKRPLLQGLTTR